MYVGRIETRSFKILLKSFHKNYSDLLKKQHGSLAFMKCYKVNYYHNLYQIKAEMMDKKGELFFMTNALSPSYV